MNRIPKNIRVHRKRYTIRYDGRPDIYDIALPRESDCFLRIAVGGILVQFLFSSCRVYTAIVFAIVAIMTITVTSAIILDVMVRWFEVMVFEYYK